MKYVKDIKEYVDNDCQASLDDLEKKNCVLWFQIDCLYRSRKLDYLIAQALNEVGLPEPRCKCVEFGLWLWYLPINMTFSEYYQKYEKDLRNSLDNLIQAGIIFCIRRNASLFYLKLKGAICMCSI